MVYAEFLCLKISPLYDEMGTQTKYAFRLVKKLEE